MYENTRKRLLRYTVVAVVAIIAGLIISFRSGGTWWLLVMAALAWIQALLLRREIVTSGLPLRLFNTVAWSLLGFALASLLPDPARIIGDVVVLLIAIATFVVAPHVRRAR